MLLNHVGLFAIVITASFAAFSSVSTLLAGSPISLGSPTHSKRSLADVDHQAWSELLADYTNQDGRVDYRRWVASPADVAKLDQYLAHLSSADDQLPAPKAAKLAFWINTYNAVTVKGILREYPTTSIRNHTPKLFGYNIWHDLQINVGGTPRSLDTIEHKILRKMGEPRIHFAIVCASIGCPRLLNEAYLASTVDEQLERNAKDFFARTQNFRYETNASRVQVSSILNWFGEDFGNSNSEVLRRIARWLPSEASQQAASTGNLRISYLDYNWQLNSQN